MIIDFHTHVFPDKIAVKTIEHLAALSGIVPHSDGSVCGLKGALERAGADLAVTLPVVTNPTQFDSINRFAASLNESDQPVLSFGGIHPDCEDLTGKMRTLKEMGFKGVKIHPDYQETFFDDARYLEILRAASEFDLIVVTHAGVDDGYVGKPVRCTPDRVLNALNYVPNVKLVLAHLGGNRLEDEVYDKLLGRNVYIDTAYNMHVMPKEAFLKFVKKHGANKILFATDSPWRDIQEEVAVLKRMGLSKEDEEKIFFRNAQALLNL